MAALRLVSLAVALGGMAMWVAWARRTELPGYAVAPVLWLAHVAVFYAARLACLPVSVTVVNVWSSVIHLHAAFTVAVAGAGAALLWTRRRRAEDG